MNAHYSTLAVTILGDGKGKKEDEDEEEEEDDDVDELPESMIQSASKAGKTRASVSAEAYGAWNQKKEFTPPVHAKSDEQKTRLVNCLKNSFMFEALAEKDFNVTVDAMEEVTCGAGETIIKQGDE